MSIDAPFLARDYRLGEIEQRPALIGPNAVLQIVGAMERRLGPEKSDRLCRKAGLAELPSGLEMIEEGDALRLHCSFQELDLEDVEAIARDAGHGTADYIIANRIPRLVVRILRALPGALAAPLLMSAIRRHAWTFIGAGRYKIHSAWRFTIDRSHCEEMLAPPRSLFVWYQAVFEGLYRQLVSPRCLCELAASHPERSVAKSYDITIVRG